MKKVAIENEPIRFKTNYNVQKFPEILHKNPFPSETIPGSSMTIPEILMRCRTGMNPAVQHSVSYEGTADDLTFEMLNPTHVSDFDIVDADEIERMLEYKKQQAENQPIEPPVPAQEPQQ